ncbi:TonB-dependent siderophore receptor [Steroidobacter sp.]|uniref:TonB-dependent siderophore receptor n=1 Tax=Steroidobacter sp. TaxID=1978227 RepID=UPI001A377D8D|nr:TonB-dependent receptor [Steroidobacter sp.]MBL8268322.1 TonB-dependent receptor [Steroidobacter sp.]
MRTLLAAAIVCLTVAGPSHAADSQSAIRKTFNIPAQGLGSALQALSKEQGFHVVFMLDDVERQNTAGISGEMTVQEALERLLKGTGLGYEYVDAQTVTIVPLATQSARRQTSAVSSNAGDSTMRLAQANAASQENGASDFEEVVVTGVQFRHAEVLSATKMPQSVKDTPQSVKVVTNDLMAFAGIRNFEDFDRVDASSGSTHQGLGVPRNYFRGFATQSVNAIKVDGYRQIGFVTLDLAPFERFEVVKGPTSMLYGQNPIAGTLNAISKLPQQDFGLDVGLEYGSFAHRRGDFDVHGSLTDAGELSYRLIAAFKEEDSYLDFGFSRTLVLAPSLQYQLSDDTSVTARVIYQRDRYMPYGGFGAQFLGDDLSDPSQLTPANFRIPDVPESRAGNAPTDLARDELMISQLMLDHKMGSWSLRGNVQYNELSERDARGAFILGTDRDGFTTTLPFRESEPVSVYSAEMNLFGDVELFGRRHTLFFGADYAQLERDLTSMSNFLFGASSGFSILDPDYDLIYTAPQPENYFEHYTSNTKQTMYGLTVQALLRPLDGLTISVGTRYSHDVQKTRAVCCDLGATLDGVTADRLKEDAFTEQVGITYALTRDLNVYASYGTTFEPQSGFEALNKPIDPQEGSSYEVGLKGDTLGRRLSYSIALFDMERSNIAQGQAGSPFLVPIGTQRSKGVELDFQGELLKGWQVFGSLAVMDAEYTQGQYKGAQPTAAPKRGVSLFTSYEIQGGDLRGLGFGGGVIHKGGRNTNDFDYGANTPITFLGDFTEVDLRVFYTRQNWTFDVTATNVFDERYYSAVFERLSGSLNINRPRAITASVRYRL